MLSAPVGAAANGYDKTELTAPSGTPFTIDFNNQDANVPHNVDIEAEGQTTPLFEGELITGVAQASYAVDPLDAGQEAAAAAGGRGHRHDVADLVAEEGLQRVGQVGDQHFLARRAGGDGTVLVVDDLEDRPVRIDVGADVGGAAVGEERAFAGGVVVHDVSAEGGLDPLTGPIGEDLAVVDHLLQCGGEPQAAGRDRGAPITRLRVDGGLTRSATLLQVQADLAQCPVEVYPSPHATALGVAELAAIGARIDNTRDDWGPATTFEPAISTGEAAARLEAWQAVAAATLAL
jgi:hypothetical protein